MDYQPYDWRISLKKTVRTVLLVAALAVADHFADKARAGEAAQGAPYAEFIVAALVGGATWIRNYLKNA